MSIKTGIDIDRKFPELSKVNNDIAGLTMAVYSPMSYILPTKIKEYEEKYDQTVREGKSVFKQIDRERAIVNLMRVNMLKRMESSVHSFALTLSRLLEKINKMIEILNSDKEFSFVFDSDDEDYDYEGNTIGDKIQVNVEDIDKIRMLQDLNEDKAAVDNLLSFCEIVDEDNDEKLIKLKEIISEKINNPLNDNNKKIIVFTTFSDTADYLYDKLSPWLLKEHNLHTALVSGSATRVNTKNINNKFDAILSHFSPKSNRYDTKGNDIDLLIATDCISEGQNLQDCDYLINYDIHWNPVQRFGRVDRIGSENKFIQLVNFWPNMELDEYINLINRVKNKMVMLDMSATADDNLIMPELKELEYRKKQLEQLQKEVLEVEEMQGGISITDLTLDDFIMSLDRYMKDNPNVLERYPTGIYSVTNIDEKVKDECVKGVIYCLKQTKYTEIQDNATSLYPYYLVYVSNTGDIHITNTNPKHILDIFKAICENKTEPIESLVKEFNKETKNGTDMTRYSELLEKAVFDIKGIVEQKGIESLFKIGQSTLLENTISGLNDFELISFLVVK